MKEYKLLNLVQLNEMKDFIKENSYWIYKYINTDILENVGEINFEYFVKVIQDMFEENTNIKICEYSRKPNVLPYFIFTLLEGKGRLDYTSLRVETINFDKINKEASVYYNYARFSLKDESLCIELMQTKIGGMPINEDIVKFTKNISIKNSGLEEFINKNKKVEN